MNQSDGYSGAPDVMMSIIGAACAVEERIEQKLATEGLSMAKLGVLKVLVNAPQPLSLGEVATRLACVRSNVTQLVDRLEADGLVQRQPDPNDRRSITAVITPEGRTRQEAGAKVMESLQAQVTQTLGAFDVDQIDHAMKSLS
jgi:MarR family transcriptional regulator for hemolysin